MDAWNADLLLNVIQYLSVRDSGSLAATSKRFLYLVTNYQRLRPECVAATSQMPGVRTRQRNAKELCNEAIDQIQSKPNVALYFGKLYGNKPMVEEIPQYLPASTAIVGVSASAIQSSFRGEIECTSRASLMLLSMPRVSAVPMCFEQNVRMEQVNRFLQELAFKDDNHWKVFMLFATGDFGMQGLKRIFDTVQRKHPEAAIVGGICDQGHISLPPHDLLDGGDSREDVISSMPSSALIATLEMLGEKPIEGKLEKKNLIDQLREVVKTKPFALRVVDNGIFGVALGGEVPVRSIVSRGVRSLTCDGRPQPTTPFFVEQASFHRPGDEGYMFRLGGPGAPSYHMINRIRNRDTGRSYTLPDIVQEFGPPQLLGLRQENADGFVLENIHPISMGLHSFIILDHDIQGDEPRVGFNVDLFELDGEACKQDMVERMQQLRDITKDEQLLGALMFSCNGRGPSASRGLLGEEMSDARCFANAFPNVPCLGFYAGGEIGPIALAGRQNVFQTGKVCYNLSYHSLFLY